MSATCDHLTQVLTIKNITPKCIKVTFISHLSPHSFKRVESQCLSYGGFKLFILTIVIYKITTHVVCSTTLIYQSKGSTFTIKINRYNWYVIVVSNEMSNFITNYEQ